MGRRKTDVEKQQLSERELAVAKLLACGHPNGDIARGLKISIKTVDTHRLNILRKLALRNNVELARYMLRIGEVAL